MFEIIAVEGNIQHSEVEFAIFFGKVGEESLGDLVSTRADADE